MSYVPLWCKSHFSFLEGASHPDELVEAAHRQGLRSLALTDRDGVYGIVRAHEKAIELGIDLIIGAEVTVDGATAETPPSTLVLLAQNRDGYAQLCRLLTIGRRRAPKGQSLVTWQEVQSHSSNLIALWGGDRSLLVGLADPSKVAHGLKEAFADRLYAMVTRHRRAEEVVEEARLRERAAYFELPIVAGQEVLYHLPSRRPLQDVLTCIRNGVTLYQAGRLIKPNAEHDLKSPHAFTQLYADDPLALARTIEVAARCRFSLTELRYRYPSERLPDGKTSTEWLRELTLAGARDRYGDEIPAAALAQIDKELLLVEELDYSGYFLTMYEIVEFCRRQNILCQGRGSAANSVVCYCLKVTAIDPVRMNLLFERFISRERAEPPDIDLDIEHERREEVTQHVYGKYGRDHAAMVANFIRYRARSAVRDVGKVLGLSETSLDRLARILSHHDTIDGAMAHSGIDVAAGQLAHFSRLTQEILGVPRHLSIHPGGFLLGHEPVSNFVPIENGTMEDRTVIQFDKDDVESLRLFKVDLLGLGALTHLHRTFDLLDKHHTKKWSSMADIPEGDPATYDMICSGDTVGVFQIESRAQMAMLPRLQPRTYYDLVIEVSIVRPGPITGGMVHPYLRRRFGQEPIDYPHPSLEPVLKKTLGIPLFQEQVMKLAVVAADYTPGEADQLRRDMAAWRRDGRIAQHRDRLVSRMQKKGIAVEFAERVFQQICGFGEYGFPESHAASFALISYAGSYLKCHYPAEFTCGLLNALPMGFYSAATIIEDAKRHGVEVRPIDLAQSDWDCTLERSLDSSTPPTFAIRMGLRFVKGLGQKEWATIERHRPFESIEALAASGLNEKAMSALSEAGALTSLSTSRRSALWESLGLARARPTPLSVDHEPPSSFAPLSEREVIGWDYRASSHSTHGHPLAPLREALSAQGLPDARMVTTLPHGRRVRYAGLVICRQRPGTASGVTFMTLEDESGFVNVVLWTQVFERYLIVAKTQSFLGITGKLQKQDNVVHLVAEALWIPEIPGMPVPEIDSRDFH